MKVWTSDDPGAGDMSVIDAWGAAVTGEAEAYEAAATTLKELSASSKEHWEGKGADAFADAIDLEVARLDLVAVGCHRSASAATTYARAVEEIRKAAAEHRLRISEAAAELKKSSSTDSKDSTSSYAPNPPEYDVIRIAWEGIEDLGVQRHTVDQTFMRDVLSQMSGKIGTDHDEYKRPTDEEYERASDLTIEQLLIFAGGLAQRDNSYTEGPFVDALADSGHINQLRESIISRLQRGDDDLERREQTRSLSTDWTTLISDGFNAATLGHYGNLPETMLGSFQSSYEIVAVNGNEATVTFTITNDTTQESLNRVPGVPYVEMPWAPGVHIADAQFDGYKPTGQTVVWTEVITF